MKSRGRRMDDDGGGIGGGGAGWEGDMLEKGGRRDWEIGEKADIFDQPYPFHHIALAARHIQLQRMCPHQCVYTLTDF